MTDRTTSLLSLAPAILYQIPTPPAVPSMAVIATVKPAIEAAAANEPVLEVALPQAMSRFPWVGVETKLAVTLVVPTPLAGP